MKQTHFEENLYDYVTKRMDERDYQLAEEHVKGCARCQGEIDELTQTLELLEEFQPPPLPASYKMKVRKEIQDFPLPAKQLLQRLRDSIRVPYIKWTLEGIAVTALILLTFTIYRNLTPEGIHDTEKAPKGEGIRLNQVKNPVIIEVADTEIILEKIKEIIRVHGGQVLQVIQTTEGMRVTFSPGKEGEKTILNEF
jgi:hypothetical protein